MRKEGGGAEGLNKMVDGDNPIVMGVTRGGGGENTLYSEK